MKKFLKKILFFIIPILIYVGIVVAIDPYNFFRRMDTVFGQDEEKIAFNLNYPLFKLLKFEKNPTENILLGDSRTGNLDIDFSKSCTTPYTNLAYGGGTLKEAIKTFWAITGKHKLKKVLFGINFNLYNEVNSMDRVSEAISLKENFASYAFSKYVFQSIFMIFKGKIFNENTLIGVPEMTREEFWKDQLNSSANNTYRIYSYPMEFYKELSQIKTYCDKNKIELVFFIPPTHTELQDKIKEFKLGKEEVKFKEDLKEFGEFYDFDFSNEVTRNKDNFKDPYHCTDSISKLVAKTIFCHEQLSKTYVKYVGLKKN